MLHFNNTLGMGRVAVIVNNGLFILGRGFLVVSALTALGAVGGFAEWTIRFVLGL